MPETTEIAKMPEKTPKESEKESGEPELSDTHENIDAVKATDIPSYDLTKFQLIEILNNNTMRKSITLLGTFPEVSATDAAVILFEKQPFQESDVRTAGVRIDSDDGEQYDDKVVVKPSYFNSDLQVHTEFVNNIYGSYECVPSANLNRIKTTVIYPATEKHIQKHSVCLKYLVTETPSLYNNVTLPYINASQLSLEWVYNILDHKEEEERIVFEDTDPETGFVLLPDLKWDGRNLDTLYLLAIPHKRGIKSVRDLTGEHLPLLRNIRTRSAEVLEKLYGFTVFQLRMYLHYQPSFYHLHVHVNPLGNDAPGIWCDKAHLLDTVINNLELMSDYYKRATLPFILFEGSKLKELYQKVVAMLRETFKRSSEDESEEDEEKEVKKAKIFTD